MITTSTNYSIEVVISESAADKDFFIVPEQPDKTDAREQFALKLAVALHRYGTPAHRLEQTMSMVMDRIGLQGSFFALPTSLFASFGRPESHRTSLIRANSGEVNLERLVLLDELADEIITGLCNVENGNQRIDRIEHQQLRFGSLATIIGMGMATGIAARIFGGGWREILVAGIIGLFIGVLGPFFSRKEQRQRVFEITTAVLASSLAVLAAHYFSPFSVFLATLAGLIFLIPGMRLTTAMTEIASGHLVSGAARLTGSVMAFLSIAFGTALGNQAMLRLAPSLPGTDPQSLPNITLWLALLLYPVSMTFLMQARFRDLPLIAFSTAIAFAGSRLGALGFGPELGAFLGAFALGIGANWIGRIMGRPAALIIAPGLLLLVPGSVGYKSITKMMEQDLLAGLGMAFSVAVIGIAIVTGLLLANAVLQSRRAL